jgi:hypothetical protein
MTDPDDKLERAYRALAKEEPPPALDAAILSAARRSVTRPSLARRWGVPVSLAAVLMLAIGVTLEMRNEKPGVEMAAPAAPEALRAAPAPAAPPPAAPAEAPAEAPVAPPVAAQLAPTPKAAAKREAAGATADVMANAHDPHAELERIAKLRAEGRDEEADRALDEFRKRFPHYRIDDATWARVKPR